MDRPVATMTTDTIFVFKFISLVVLLTTSPAKWSKNASEILLSSGKHFPNLFCTVPILKPDGKCDKKILLPGSKPQDQNTDQFEPHFSVHRMFQPKRSPNYYT
jgi:hypothetical protein